MASRILEGLGSSFIPKPEFTEPFLPQQDKTRPRQRRGASRPAIVAVELVNIAALLACNSPDNRQGVPVVPVPSISSEAGQNTTSALAPLPPTRTTEVPPSPVPTPTPTSASERTPVKAPETFLVEESRESLDSAANKILNRFSNPLDNTDCPDETPVNDPPTKYEIVVNTGNFNVGDGQKYKVYTLTLTVDNLGNPSEVHVIGQNRLWPTQYDPEWYGDTTIADMTLRRSEDNIFTIVDSGTTYTNTDFTKQEAYDTGLGEFDETIAAAFRCQQCD